MTERLTWATASDLSRLYSRKELSPVDVVDATLARAERLQPHLNFLVLLDAEAARAAARAAEARWQKGEPLSPLDGVPTSIKDTTNVKGWPTRYGSHATDETPAAEDAAITERFRRAGMVLIGKSTTPEYGWKALTDSPIQGTTRSPWNLRHTPGGSSGGASSLTASGVNPFNHGNDGGGSIRIPAAHTGLVGLKPSFGRIPQYPADSPFADVISQGVLARSVADTWVCSHRGIIHVRGRCLRPSSAHRDHSQLQRISVGIAAPATRARATLTSPRHHLCDRSRYCSARPESGSLFALFAAVRCRHRLQPSGHAAAGPGPHAQS